MAERGRSAGPGAGPPSRRRLSRGRLACVALALLALVGIVGAWTAWGIYAYSLQSETRPADAAIVLGAAAWGSEPSPVFAERINHAITLYEEGLVRVIIFTGGTRDEGAPSEAEVARQYAVERGVAEADILLETRSRITEENLRYAREVAQAAGLRTFLVVSDPLHMKRAMLMARDLGLEAYASPTPSSRYRSVSSQVPFLARETFFYLGYLLWRPFARGLPLERALAAPGP